VAGRFRWSFDRLEDAEEHLKEILLLASSLFSKLAQMRPSIIRFAFSDETMWKDKRSNQRREYDQKMPAAVCTLVPTMLVY
jgi:hypothetical protein